MTGTNVGTKVGRPEKVGMLENRRQDQPRSEEKLRSFPLTFFKTACGIAIIVFIFSYIPISQVVAVFKNLTLEWVAYLLFISVVLIYASVLKWKLLLKTQGVEERTSHLYGLYLAGYFFNLLFPSFIGGDAARSWHLGRAQGQRRTAVATFLERYSGLFTMLMLGMVFSFITDKVQTPERVTILLLFLGFVGCTALLYSKSLVSGVALLPRIGVVVGKQGALFQEALRVSTSCPRKISIVVALSFVFHALAVVNVLACAHAVGWTHAPVGELFIVVPIILIISALPVTPQALGVQEGAFVYYLTLLGALPAEAMGVALLIRAKAYVLAALGGLYLLCARPRKIGSSSDLK